jgi:hypothetical protein
MLSLHRESPAQFLGALAHAREAHAVWAWADTADAIVANFREDSVSRGPELNGHVGGTGVPVGVGERLLDHSKHCHLDGGRQWGERRHDN